MENIEKRGEHVGKRCENSGEIPDNVGKARKIINKCKNEQFESPRRNMNHEVGTRLDNLGHL